MDLLAGLFVRSLLKEILAFLLFLGQDQIINGLKKKIFLFFILILIIISN